MKCIQGCRGIVGGIDALKPLSDAKLRAVYECCHDCMGFDELRYCRERLGLKFDIGCGLGQCRKCGAEQGDNHETTCTFKGVVQREQCHSDEQ